MNIPEGHQAVMPYLMIEDAAGFIEFIKMVFEAEMTQSGYARRPCGPLRGKY